MGVIKALYVIIAIAIASLLFNRGLTEAEISSLDERELADGQHYLNAVKYFRGDDVRIDAPFAYRVMGPALASVLPLHPMTALNVVNIIALAISVLVMGQIMSVIESDKVWQLVGIQLYAVSFPVYQYAAIGYIDTIAVMMVSLAVWAILSQRYWISVIVVALSILAKETTFILLFPLMLASPLHGVIATVACAIIVLTTRHVISVGNSYVLYPMLSLFIENLNRIGTWGSALLTAFPLLFCVYPKWNRVLLVGALSAMILYGISLFTAYADGRTLWLIYPFAIPAAAQGMKHVYLAMARKGV